MYQSPRHPRLQQIEALRVRLTTIKERHVHISVREELLELENELDDAMGSLCQPSVDYRLHIVLPIADSIITTVTARLATIEDALKIDPNVSFRTQLSADE